MIELITSSIIGIVATEFIFFKFVRKKLIINTSIHQEKYGFRDFLIEKGLSMLGGLFVGFVSFKTLQDLGQLKKLVLFSLPLLSKIIMVSIPLALFVLINWKISEKLEERDNEKNLRKNTRNNYSRDV